MARSEEPTATASGRLEDERLSLGATFGYGFQHVLTMYGGIIAPPLIVGSAAGMTSVEIGTLVAACLFVGGLATILQTVGIRWFGSQLPLVQGVSFAGVSTMIAIVGGGGGIQAVLGAVLVASAIGFLITPFFAQIIRFFPPVVTGVVITTIGLTLMPVAANWAMGGVSDAPDYGSMNNIGLAFATFAVVILLSKIGSGAISRLSILIAIILGTALALATGMADFSEVGDGPIVALPMPLAFGPPTFEVAAIVSMLIVILVTLTETTADIIAVGEIVGTNVDRARIANGLRADMASSVVSPVFGSFTQSAFAQNVGLVAITGVKSRFVVSAGGVILVTLGLLPVLGRVVAAIPTPVLGGAGVVLFGSVAASGIRTLAKIDYANSMNLIIVAASMSFGMIPIAKPDFYDDFPEWFGVIFHSGISSAALMAILLNIVFNHVTRGTPENPSVFVRGTEARAVDDGTIADLDD